jgi:putative phosphonate metabolism protein
MRYAIYFTPPEDDALSRLAASWLGRDAFRDRNLAQPAVDGFTADEIVNLTGDPRRYGFHATLKAPFDLASDRSEHELLAAFDALAAVIPGFTLPQVTLGQLGAFFALVPAVRSEELQAFADTCVRHFEPFRAPLSAADIARRKPERLTESERRNLEQWGYPYVFEDFRFHMTLTGEVPSDRQPAMTTVLEAIFADFIDRPLAISHLSLFVEPERGAPFVMKRIAPLRPLSQRKTA